MTYEKVITTKVSGNQFDNIHNYAVDINMDVSTLIREFIESIGKTREDILKKKEFHNYQIELCDIALKKIEDKTKEEDKKIKKNEGKDKIKEENEKNILQKKRHDVLKKMVEKFGKGLVFDTEEEKERKVKAVYKEIGRLLNEQKGITTIKELIIKDTNQIILNLTDEEIESKKQLIKSIIG